MDVDKLSTGEKIVGISAVLLFIFMFFDWFSAEASNGLISGSDSGTAWEVFSVIDLILLVTVLVAVAVAVIRLTDAAFEPPISLNAVVAVLGGISTLLILYRIVSPPDVNEIPGFSIDVSPALGIFLGLIAAAGIAYGGYRAMQEEGVTFGDVGDQFSGGGRGGPGAGGTTQPPSSTQAPPPPPPSSTQPPPPPPPPNS